MKCCANCKWGANNADRPEHGAKERLCVRYPPKLIGKPPIGIWGGALSSMWPVTRADWVCGEWVQLEPGWRGLNDGQPLTEDSPC